MESKKNKKCKMDYFLPKYDFETMKDTQIKLLEAELGEKERIYGPISLYSWLVSSLSFIFIVPYIIHERRYPLMVFPIISVLSSYIITTKYIHFSTNLSKARVMLGGKSYW